MSNTSLMTDEDLHRLADSLDTFFLSHGAAVFAPSYILWLFNNGYFSIDTDLSILYGNHPYKSPTIEYLQSIRRYLLNNHGLIRDDIVYIPEINAFGYTHVYSGIMYLAISSTKNISVRDRILHTRKGKTITAGSKSKSISFYLIGTL